MDPIPRNTPKQTILAYLTELLRRPVSDETTFKIEAVRVIAARMGWNEVEVKIEYSRALTATRPTQS